MFRPMLACNYDEDKVKFPVMAQPKIDGVRGLVRNGILMGRSLKAFPNPKAQRMWGHANLDGLDGELYVGNETDDDLCRVTSGYLNRKDETDVEVKFKVFDLSNRHEDEYYLHRLEELTRRVSRILDCGWSRPDLLSVIENKMIRNKEELQEVIMEHLALGYEGTILRDAYGMYKEGRSTVKSGAMLKIKQFQDAEAIVVGVLEGQKNNNPKEINFLGLSERSTKKDGKVNNGVVGTIIAIDTVTKQEIEISPGKMVHDQRKFYFNNPQLLIGRVVKYKFFALGVKDKPRFPTFQCFRLDEDMS